MIDYRDLLKRYIGHVGCCEGVDFLNEIYHFTCNDEERKELDKIREETE